MAIHPVFFRFILPFLAIYALAFGLAPLRAAAPNNLALNKPASSSSIENDEHSAAKANDGDPKTCWRADDEPEGGPEWWQVDLEKPHDLTGCQIRWPFRGKNYRYKVEGSTDGKTFSLLSDQTKTTATSQVHKLKFAHARQVRYVKVTVTGLDEGCWVSISEVKVFGIEQSTGESK
jgi:alpha-L-fucosidase